MQERRALGARVVADLRALDLDNFGVQVGRQLRCPRASEHPREVPDLQVGQCPPMSGHQHMQAAAQVGGAVELDQLARHQVSGRAGQEGYQLGHFFDAGGAAHGRGLH